MTIHTREEECKSETTIVKMCLPSTSEAEHDVTVTGPSTSSDEPQQQPTSSVEIAIPSSSSPSSRENSPYPDSNNEGNENDSISESISPSVDNVGVTTSDNGDETDGRNKTQDLKYASMKYVLM